MSVVSRDPQEVVTQADWAELRQRYSNADRVAAAMALALDVETCAALLRGDPVEPARIDARELERARRRRLVRLDLTALDLLAEPVS